MGVAERYERKKNKDSAPRLGVAERHEFGLLENEINSFITANNNLFTTAEKDSQYTGYRANSQDWYNNYKSQVEKQQQIAENLKNKLQKYSGYLDADTVSKTNDYISSLGESYTKITDYAKGQYDYFSKFKDEDDYNAAVKAQELEDKMKAEDLEVVRGEIEEKQKLYDTVKDIKRNYDIGVKWNDNRLVEGAKQKLAELGLTYEGVDKLNSEILEKTIYYNNAKNIQAKLKVENEALQAKDFDEFSKIGANIVNPTQREAEGWLTIGGGIWGGNDNDGTHVGGKSVGNIVEYSRDNASNIQMGGSGMVGDYKYKHMTEDEVKVYNYYLAKENKGLVEKGSAQNYLNLLEDTLNKREAVNLATNLEDNTALELAFGIVAGVDQFKSGVKNLFNTEDDYIAPSSIQYASGMVREDLEDDGFKIFGNSIGQIGYDFITTTSNMLPSILASAAVGTVSKTAGAALGASLMGSSAAGNAYADMLNAGYDKSQARTYSTLVGLSEAGLQYALGGISKLGNGALSKFTSKTLGGIAKGINNASIQFAVKYGGEFAGKLVSEGIEEGLQEILEPFFRSMATGEKPEGVDWEQVAYSGMLGALSAGLLDGIDVVSTRGAEIGKARAIKKEGNVEALKNVGKTFSADSIAYKIADKVTDKTGAYKLSMLLHDMNANLSEQNRQDIENALVEKGIAKENAESISKWLGKAVDGGNLSKTQQSALEDNPIISQVFREVIIDRNSTVNQRLQGMMEVYGKEGQAGVDLTALEENIPTNEALSEKINVRNAYNDHIKRMAEDTVRQQFGLNEVTNRGRDTMLDGMVNDAVKIANESKKTVEDVIEEGNKVSEESGVSVKKITSIGEDGKMMVETDNGTVEDVDNIQLKSHDDAYIILSTSNMATEFSGLGIDFDVASANAVVSGYTPSSGISASDYMNGAYAAIRYGVIGQKRDTITKDSPYHQLTKSQQDYLYKIGRDIAENTTNKEESRVKSISTFKKSKNGKVTKAIRSKLKPNQDTAISTVEKLSGVGILKNNFYFFESVKGRVLIDGKYQEAMVFATDVGGYKKGEYAPNGFYQDANGDIYIDINSGSEGQGLTFYTLAHELGHFVKNQNPTGFKALADFISNELGSELENLIQNKLDLWEKLGRTEFGYMDAYEDVICDALEPMFTDGNLAERLVEHSKSSIEGKGLLKTLKKFFNDLYKRIQKAYAQLKPDDPAAIEMKKHQKTIGKVADLFAEAIVGANETFDNADIKAQKNTTEDGDVEGTSKFSFRGLNKDGIEVYETSNEIRQLSYKERMSVFLDIMENQYKGRTAKFIRNGHVYYATFENADITKNIYGDKLSDKKGWKAKINVGADGNIFELVENSQYNGSQRERGKKITAHKGVGYWDYFIKTVQIDDVVFDMIANVRKKANGEFVYSIQLNENKNKKASPSLDTQNSGLNRMLNAFNDSIRNPVENVKENFGKDSVQAETTLEENGIEVNSSTNSASLSVRYLLGDVQKSKVAKSLADRFGVTEKEALNWLTAETSLSSLILNPKYSQYLDYEADPDEVAIKTNLDYPQGTVDFSPICAKRREFTSVMNNILRLFPSHVFAATDLAKIRTIMQEEGMTIPCGICYVEDRRQLDTIVAQDFIDGLKLYREGSKTRPDGKPFNANQLKGLQLTDGDTYIPSIYELVSLEGRNKLKAKNPNMEAAWVKYNNARGMQSVRLLANEAEYKRQILDYSKSTVKAKNDKGGLRIYSFSDAEMFHLIDIIQVITDSSVVGLSLQGYTKVNEYAKAVKDTGEKLNRSLIPKGELGYHMENGKVVLDYDTVEGIDINSKDFFDNKDNPNVGNITIGVSDVQIRAAMVSDFVDQIIPFHTGQSAEVLGEKGIATWTNYKDFQAEKDISTGKKSAHQINIYTEVLQALEKEGTTITKRSFVEKFLQVCKENELIPRFSQFLNTNENGEYIYTEGYHKMLVDFKTFAQTEVGEYLPQMPVKPIFDNEYITNLLKDYVGTQKVKDAAIAESMPKVIERITNEIINPSEQGINTSATKYSDRNIQPITETEYKDIEKHFGTTGNFRVAGYLLTDGKLLDFSGKHWGDTTSRMRQVDHRDVQEVLGRGNNGINDMIDMIGNGNIRLMPEIGGINLAVYPNEKQRRVLSTYINYMLNTEGKVIIDYDTIGGDTVYSKSYGKTATSKQILNDIRNYFNGARQSELMSFHTMGDDVKYSDRDTLGNVLSKGQQEFFKDSKVRDENGNLMVVYHGTDADFTVFEKRKGTRSLGMLTNYEVDTRGFFFSPSYDFSKEYGGKVKPYYLDVKNPLLRDTDKINLNNLDNTGKTVFYDEERVDKLYHILEPVIKDTVLKDPSYSLYEDTDDNIKRKKRWALKDLWQYFDGDIFQNMSLPWEIIDNPNFDECLSRMTKLGYDGFMVSEGESNPNSWVVLNSNQAKLTSNTNPTTDPDIRFSDRDYRLNSRNLLANALESSVTNPTEREWLNKYKAQIDSLNEDQKRLDEINAEIKRISFTKGSDRSKLTALNNNKKTLTARITRADKKLLEFEASKPLKNVLEVEKKKAVQRAKDEARENLKAEKEKSAQNIRELMNRYTERIERSKEGRDKTALRHKIIKVVKDLNNLLLKPTKERHIPEEMRVAVAEALSIVNMDTVDAENRVAHYNELISKATDPDVIASLTETRDRILTQGNKLSEKLGKLKEAYENVRDSTDDSLKSLYDDVIYNKIVSVQGEIKGTPIRNMTLKQLESVYELYTAVLTTVRDSNKAFAEDLKMTRQAIGSNVFAEIKDNNKARDRINHPLIEGFGWKNLKPMQAMKTIGSAMLQKLWNNVLYGQEVFAQDYDEAVKFAKEIKEKHGYNNWDLNKLYSFESKSGKAMKINLEQMMSIYAYSKRKQADEHIEYGGIVLNESVIKEKDKLGKTVEVKVNDSTAYRLNKLQVGKIIATLEQEFPGAKEFVDDMQRYLSDVMGEKGNEVSMKMYGIKLFKEEHYFPLKSSKDFMEAANAKLKGDVKIKNKGMTKAVVEHAKNPIVLEGFLDVWGNHINEMAMYHGLVLPLEDFSKALNYSFKADDKANIDAESVRTALHDAFGDNADNYLNELLKAINGGVLHDSSAEISDKMLSKFKKAKVMASLSVVVQQPTAIIRAMGIIEPKYFTSQNFRHKETWEELKKYCPTAIIKETGSFDTNMGKTIVDMVKDERGFIDKTTDFLAKAPAYMDEVGWNMIWRALKNKVATEQNLSGEALLKECGKQMTLILNETQVYDSVMARSEMMRSKSTLTKMTTSFMAEPITVANMIYSAVLDFARGKKKVATKTVAATIASIVINGLVSSIVYALRDDDEDETFLDKYISSATTEVLDGLNPLTYIPIVKDAYSLAQGYSVERTDLALIGDLIDAIGDFYKVLEPEEYEGMSRDEIAKHIYENAVPLLTSICDLFGLPVGNILRDAEAIIINNNLPLSQTTSAGIGNAFGEGVLNTLPTNVLPKSLQGKIHTDSKSDDLYNAIVNVDTANLDRLKKEHKDSDAYESAVRKALKENDPRIKAAAEAKYSGDLDTFKQIVLEIKAEGYFSQDDIVSAINSIVGTLKKKSEDEPTTEWYNEESEDTENEESSVYKNSDINDALERGDTSKAKEIITDIVDAKVKSGKTEAQAKSSIKSSLASYWKPIYLEASAEEKVNIRKMLKSTGVYSGATEIVKLTRKWEKYSN